MRETETVPTDDDATPARRTGAPEPLSLSDYPESDGKPMAETPIHWHATVDAAQPLQEFYRDRADVYVGSDMMMYYREGDIRACVSPDVFVAFEAPKLPERRVWRTWVEGRPIQKSCAIGFRVMKAPQQLASELIPSAWSPVEAPNEVWMSVVERL